MADNLREIAVSMKAAKYPQDLTHGDNYIIDKTGEYNRFAGQEINDDYTRVPTLAGLVTQLSAINYLITQTFVEQIDGENVCEYKIEFRGNMIVSNNIWAAMARLWLLVKSC
jgi:hypothetical protein